MERKVGARRLGSLRTGSMLISGRACQVGELIEFLVLGGDIDERKEGTPSSGSGAALPNPAPSEPLTQAG